MDAQSMQIIRGLPFPDTPWIIQKNIEDTLDYVPRDGDIIIASYPKTGTTWLQYIVLQVTSRGECFPSFDDLLNKVAPFMEMTGIEVIENLKPPRIYKHHYPYNMIKKNKKAKYLYIYRNPADTLVSYYHFTKEITGDETLDFDQFFEGYLTGLIRYGRIFEHVQSYWKQKDDGNLLLVSYEKLLANRKEEILRIAKFLGDEYFRNLQDNEDILEKIVQQTSFEYMKTNLYLTHKRALFSENATETTVEFFRNGTVGSGKKALSQDQMKRLKEVTIEVMMEKELIKEWL